MSETVSARRLSTHILWLMSLFALMAFGGMVLVVFEAVRNTDQGALERQRQLVRHAIDEQVQRLSQDQESVVFWEIAVLRAKTQDAAWLQKNVGMWMREYFRHDRTLILTPTDEPLMSVRTDSFYGGTDGDLIAAFSPRLHALRRQVASAREAEAIAERDIMLIANRPAVVSAMPFLPHSDRIEVAPGQEHILLSVQYLDSAFLERLRNAYLLADARIRLTDTSLGPETALPISGRDGTPLAYLVWNPALPGHELMRAVLSPAVLAGALVLLLFGLYARQVYRSSAALEASEVHARHLAFHDTLTGLPNRSHLLRRLDTLLPLSAAQGAALIFVDLDRFKEVNDTYGHQSGDEVIRQFAARAISHLPLSDTFCRLGGDEFAFLLCGISSDAQIAEFCERIVECAVASFHVPGGKAKVDVSAGYAWLGPALSRSEVLRRADAALYAAKREGGGCYRAFSPQTDAAMRARRQIEEELAAALEKGGEGLCVYYQPVIVSRSGAIVGVEALVRWQHPRLGFVAPALFVPVAEETGLIAKLDAWVLATACRAALSWPGLTLAVNISPRSFRNAGLSRRVLKTLLAERFEPARLEIEVTESALLDEKSGAACELERLRERGVRVAIDDFGTGYSSLARLRTLKADKVKVDRSFVQNMGETAETTAIVDAVIDLGHALGLTVTAEGVESELQREYLRSAGCDQMQGFFFSAPVPAEEISQMLADAVHARARGVA